MKKCAAPLILALIFHALLFIVLLCLDVQQHDVPGKSATDSVERFATYHVLYEASSNREFAYNVQNNNFTPVAILANSALTLLPLSWAARVFTLLSAVALLSATWLLWKAVFGSSSGWGNDPSSRKFTVMIVALTLFSAPLFQVLYAGSIDCFVMLLIASAIFLGTASREVAAGERLPAVRRNLDLLGGVALAGAVGLNPYCAVLLIPLAVLKLWRVILGAVVGLALIFAASPKLWSDFWLVHVPGTAELFYRAPSNASITSALHLFAWPAEHRLIPYQAPPVLIAGIVGVAVLLLTIRADLGGENSGHTSAAASGKRAAIILTYAPLVLAVPFTVDPSSLVFNLMLLPAFVVLQRQAETRAARVGLDIAVLGWALTQSHLASANLFHAALFPAAISGLGSLLLLSGLLSCKWTSRAGVAREAFHGVVFAPRAADALVCQIAGAGLLLMTCVLYSRWGFGYPVFTGWCASILFFYLSFSPSQELWNAHLRRRDVLISAALLAVFAAPYLAGLYTYPVQVNTDELIQLNVANRLVTEGSDWFGIDVHYFFFPKGGFLVIGQMSRLLGGITFEHVRQACGFISLMSILAAYIFYRQFLQWKLAFAAAAMLGFSHVLFGLSRAVCRENLPLLLELSALTFFAIAWRRRSSRLMFLGGIISGLGVYSYYTGRMIAYAWIAYLCLRFILERAGPGSRAYLKWAAIAAFGYAVAAAPMYTASAKIPASEEKYLHEQIVIYPEGRALVCNWENTQDVPVALARNIGRGLTMFNNGAQDHANTYINPGHGIVDPITGALLWLGIYVIVRRRKWRLGTSGILTFLLVIWIPFSLLLTKNPGYSRNLILLPFVFYLALAGARYLAGWVARRISVPGRKFRTALVGGLAVFICAWNAWIYFSYVMRGVDTGDGVGSTIRYVDSLSTRRDCNFYVVMDQEHPYYWFGGDSWKPWIATFSGPEHPVELVSSKPFLDRDSLLDDFKKPCVILMPGQLYRKCDEHLKVLFPTATAKKITANGEQMAIELLEAAK